MFAVILAVVIAAAALLLGGLLRGRPSPGDEIERFHRARQMTTDWSRQGPAQPVFADDAAIDLTDSEPADRHTAPDRAQHVDA